MILYKKGTYFLRISDESARIRTFLRNGRVRGKLIGRVRVKETIYNLSYLKIVSQIM